MRVARADGTLARSEVSLIRVTLTGALEFNKKGLAQLRIMMKQELSEPIEGQVVKLLPAPVRRPAGCGVGAARECRTCRW